MAKTLFYFALECAPGILYYIVSYHTDFRTATAIYVAATALVVALMLRLQKRLPYLSLIFAFFVVTSGIATVVINNPDIIILSDTIYFLFGATVLAYSLFRPRTLLEVLFSPSFAITRTGWRLLSYAWIAVFLIAGITNDLVRIFMTPEWWIGFQFWRGVIIAMLSLGFLFITKHYRLPEATQWGIRITK